MKITALNAPASATAPDTSRLRRAAEDFTAVALNELLKPMFETTDQSGGLFGGGAAEKAFRPMMVTEIAKSIAHQGGLGLVQPILTQMIRMQEASL